MQSELSEIAAVYENSTIFVTGATGFIGKLLVEKILRSLNPRRVYLMVRPKKNKTVEERFGEIFKSIAFDEVKKNSNYLDRVYPIMGDCTRPNLSLSDDDVTKLVDEVNFVFHCAATVRFDESIRTATQINIRATRDLLQIARKMKQLKMLVHVSTAYSHCPRSEIGETFYEMAINPHKLIEIVDSLTEDMLEKTEKSILDKWPNTYTMTKALAENLVYEASIDIPVAVMRPSIVVGCAKEPMVGFSDNLMGMTGMCVGSGLGVIHTIHCDPNYKIDMIPVDFVVNNLLAICWYLIKNPSTKRELRIFNCVSGKDNPITFGDFTGQSLILSRQFPCTKLMWYPFAIYTPNRLLFLLLNFLFHTLPAHIVDFFASFAGKKLKLVESYRKFGKMSDCVSYFVLHEWNFQTDNNRKIIQSLSSVDKKLFNFDILSIIWPNYVRDLFFGFRCIICQDPVDTIPQGHRKLLGITIAHYFIIGAFFAILFLTLKLVVQVTSFLLHVGNTNNVNFN